MFDNLVDLSEALRDYQCLDNVLFYGFNYSSDHTLTEVRVLFT